MANTWCVKKKQKTKKNRKAKQKVLQMKNRKILERVQNEGQSFTLCLIAIHK